MNSEEGAVHTKLSDVSGDFLKLHLKRSSFDSLLEFPHNLPDAAVLSYDDTYKPALTSGNLCAREQDGRWKIMRIFVIRL